MTFWSKLLNRILIFQLVFIGPLQNAFALDLKGKVSGALNKSTKSKISRAGCKAVGGGANVASEIGCTSLDMITSDPELIELVVNTILIFTSSLSLLNSKCRRTEAGKEFKPRSYTAGITHWIHKLASLIHLYAEIQNIISLRMLNSKLSKQAKSPDQASKFRALLEINKAKLEAAKKKQKIIELAALGMGGSSAVELGLSAAMTGWGHFKTASELKKCTTAGLSLKGCSVPTTASLTSMATYTAAVTDISLACTEVYKNSTLTGVLVKEAKSQVMGVVIKGISTVVGAAVGKALGSAVGDGKVTQVVGTAAGSVIGYKAGELIQNTISDMVNEQAKEGNKMAQNSLVANDEANNSASLSQLTSPDYITGCVKDRVVEKASDHAKGVITAAAVDSCAATAGISCGPAIAAHCAVQTLVAKGDCKCALRNAGDLPKKMKLLTEALDLPEDLAKDEEFLAALATEIRKDKNLNVEGVTKDSDVCGVDYTSWFVRHDLECRPQFELFKKEDLEEERQKELAAAKGEEVEKDPEEEKPTDEEVKKDEVAEGEQTGTDPNAETNAENAEAAEELAEGAGISDETKDTVDAGNTDVAADIVDQGEIVKEEGPKVTFEEIPSGEEGVRLYRDNMGNEKRVFDGNYGRTDDDPNNPYNAELTDEQKAFREEQIRQSFEDMQRSNGQLPPNEESSRLAAQMREAELEFQQNNNVERTITPNTTEGTNDTGPSFEELTTVGVANSETGANPKELSENNNTNLNSNSGVGQVDAEGLERLEEAREQARIDSNGQNTQLGVDATTNDFVSAVSSEGSTTAEEPVATASSSAPKIRTEIKETDTKVCTKKIDETNGRIISFDCKDKPKPVAAEQKPEPQAPSLPRYVEKTSDIGDEICTEKIDTQTSIIVSINCIPKPGSNSPRNTASQTPPKKPTIIRRPPKVRGNEVCVDLYNVDEGVIEGTECQPLNTGGASIDHELIREMQRQMKLIDGISIDKALDYSVGLKSTKSDQWIKQLMNDPALTAEFDQLNFAEKNQVKESVNYLMEALVHLKEFALPSAHADSKGSTVDTASEASFLGAMGIGLVGILIFPDMMKKMLHYSTVMQRTPVRRGMFYLAMYFLFSEAIGVLEKRQKNYKKNIKALEELMKVEGIPITYFNWMDMVLNPIATAHAAVKLTPVPLCIEGKNFSTACTCKSTGSCGNEITRVSLSSPLLGVKSISQSMALQQQFSLKMATGRLTDNDFDSMLNSMRYLQKDLNPEIAAENIDFMRAQAGQFPFEITKRSKNLLASLKSSAVKELERASGRNLDEVRKRLWKNRSDTLKDFKEADVKKQITKKDAKEKPTEKIVDIKKAKVSVAKVAAKAEENLSDFEIENNDINDNIYLDLFRIISNRYVQKSELYGKPK